jgi:hypothetical protein
MCGRCRGIGRKRGRPQTGNASRLVGCLGELARAGSCSGRASHSGSRRGQRPGRCTVNPVTALVLTTVEHRLRPGEWLAQTAAGSTVGRLALQLARSEGFRTLNVVRRSAQVAEIAALGGDRLRWRSGRRRRGARTATRRQTSGLRRALLAPAVRSGGIRDAYRCATVDSLGIQCAGMIFVSLAQRHAARGDLGRPA